MALRVTMVATEILLRQAAAPVKVTLDATEVLYTIAPAVPIKVTMIATEVLTSWSSLSVLHVWGYFME